MFSMMARATKNLHPILSPLLLSLRFFVQFGSLFEICTKNHVKKNNNKAESVGKDNWFEMWFQCVLDWSQALQS